MSDSFAKKEIAKKKAREKKEKAEKMKERKANNDKGKSLNHMMAYLDENGNITSVPPGDKKREEIKLEDIQLGAAPIIPEDVVRTGTVAFFNTDKGFGFITDDKTKENIFVHSNQLLQPVKERDRVTFERERTPRGYSAIKVKTTK